MTRRFSDSSSTARPPRQQLNLVQEVASLEREHQQQLYEEELEYQAYLAHLQYEEEQSRLEREHRTSHHAGADDNEGYFTADEEEDHVRLHHVNHQEDEEHLRRLERLDVLPILANLPMEATSNLPLPVRQRIEKYRTETVNRDRDRGSDRDNHSHRNDSPQWQSQRNSDRSNPGRLVESQKRVTFGNVTPNKGACTSYLKGQCTKGDACFWSHDWDVCMAEGERIAENLRAQKALRAKSTVVASMSSTNNRQQTEPAT